MTTQPVALVRSGWCPPWNHPTGHKDCQKQIAKRAVTCECPDHGGHPTTPRGEAA